MTRAEPTESVIWAWLTNEGLSLCGEGDERTLAKPVPIERAKEIVAKLEALGADASWARDGDDGSLAWVYV